MSSDNQSAKDADSNRRDLLELSHHLGAFEQMAILGEGNVSGRLCDDRLLIKASGTQLGTLTADQLVEVDGRPILEAMSNENTSDAEIEALLLESRVDPEALKPSVETLFHAWLLGLPNVEAVGHTHPIAVNQLLCSPRAKEFAERRLFPDHIVYCGSESVLIPYVDPGIVLARRIAQDVDSFVQRTGGSPKTILLENHGIIALGATVKQVEAALTMSEKAARVFLGACSAGGPIFLPQAQVDRIAGRMDEHHRQRMLEGG